MASSSLGQYATYVRTLRIVLALPLDEYEGGMYRDVIHQAMSLCTNSTSLTIYYDQLPGLPLRELGFIDMAVALISRGNLRSLTISSTWAGDSSWWYRHIMNDGLAILLAGIVPTLDHFRQLRNLEITSGFISGDVYDGIRSKATFLDSLTFRYCLGIALGRIWDEGQIAKWAPNQNLTRLNLINCQNGYAPHIPSLIRHFSSLRHLFISACGDFSDVEPPPRQAGWNRESNALWKHRAPLDVLHIEHSLEWEILALGIIPTRTLVATSLIEGHLFGAFVLDEEIFPGLTLLKISNVSDNTLNDPRSPSHRSLQEWERILKLRNIELQEGAEWLVNTRGL